MVFHGSIRKGTDLGWLRCSWRLRSALVCPRRRELGRRVRRTARRSRITRGKKLVFKDGTFQLVRDYEKKGDRVRYFSLERGEWEEIPGGDGGLGRDCESGESDDGGRRCAGGEGAQTGRGSANPDDAGRGCKPSSGGRGFFAAGRRDVCSGRKVGDSDSASGVGGEDGPEKSIETSFIAAADYSGETKYRARGKAGDAADQFRRIRNFICGSCRRRTSRSRDWNARAGRARRDRMWSCCARRLRGTNGIMESVRSIMGQEVGRERIRQFRFSNGKWRREFTVIR